MGPACSKPPGDIATAAGVAQLPKIHGGAVLDAWCGGDNSVVTAGADGRVVLYDAAAGTAKTLGVHAAAANGVAAARDRAGAVYTCSRDLSVRRWPLARGPTQVIEAAHELAVTAVTVADDGATVASGSRDYRVKTWDAATGENAAAVRVQRNGRYYGLFAVQRRIMISMPAHVVVAVAILVYMRRIEVIKI